MAHATPRLHPPGPRTPIERVLSPMQDFLSTSASTGILLIAATVIAMILANTGLAPLYNQVLGTHLMLSLGFITLDESVLHWINDGLMAIFFLYVGLEIKREMLVGELSDIRAALLPMIAAVGGAVVPALIYLGFNAGGPGLRGWGVPMATDIAFALGVLALLGDRIPFGLKVFLTAVAIVDDLLAVLVIALFYTADLNTSALLAGLGVLALMMLANALGVRRILFYIALGLVVWVAFLKSGVHATIAGVLIAFTIPGRNRIDPASFLARARGLLQQFEQSDLQPTRMLTDEVQQSTVIALEDACEQVQAPLQKLEHSLHPWVSFLIMPVFALANAGISLADIRLSAESLPVILGVVLGLVLGKPVGLLLATMLLVRTRLSALPNGVTWPHMVGVGFLAGIGFTMSLFIAALAFPGGAQLTGAKLGIVLASIIAGTAGSLLLLRAPAPAGEQAPAAAPG